MEKLLKSALILRGQILSSGLMVCSFLYIILDNVCRTGYQYRSTTCRFVNVVILVMDKISPFIVVIFSFLLSYLL